MRPIMERDLVLTAGFHCQYIPGRLLSGPEAIGKSLQFAFNM